MSLALRMAFGVFFLRPLFVPRRPVFFRRVCFRKQKTKKVVSECHLSWRNLVGKAELGEVTSNLSVSRLSDLASDMDPEAAMNGFEDEDEGGDGEEEYPTSLIA